MTDSNVGAQGASVPQMDEASKLAPFNPSSAQIQAKALDMLNLTSSDVLFDLGCGDGRFLIHAASLVPGLRCVGVELDKKFVDRANESLQRQSEDVVRRVDIRFGDALDLIAAAHARQAGSGVPASALPCSKLDLLDHATVLYLFVLPKGIVKLTPLLELLVEKKRQEHSCVRVLSYMFKIGCWQPTRVDRTSKGNMPVYLYSFDFREQELSEA